MKLERQMLIVRSDRGEPLIELEWSHGQTRAVHVVPDLAPVVERWLTFGVDDYVGEGDAAIPRCTLASSSLFLEHLEDYLAKQFSFRMTLKTVEQPLVQTEHIAIPESAMYVWDFGYHSSAPYVIQQGSPMSLGTSVQTQFQSYRVGPQEIAAPTLAALN